MTSLSAILTVLFAAFAVFPVTAIEGTFEVGSRPGLDCSRETSGEGKIVYINSDASKNETLCCSKNMGQVQVDNSQWNYDHVKSKSGIESGIDFDCCVPSGHSCSRTGVECCQSNACHAVCVSTHMSEDTWNRVEPGKKPLFTVDIKLIEAKPCADQYHRHHIEISVGGLHGDACCDSKLVHMISLFKHCCSTSRTPCIYLGNRGRRRDFDFMPECCGAGYFWDDDPKGCRDSEEFIGNLIDVKSEADRMRQQLKSLTRNQVYSINIFTKKPYSPIGFCHDNRSGGWNVSLQLGDMGRPNLGGQKSSRKCCGSSPHKGAPFELEHACCNDPEDRFRSNEIIEKSCCIDMQSSSGTERNYCGDKNSAGKQRYRCCIGECTAGHGSSVQCQPFKWFRFSEVVASRHTSHEGKCMT